MAASVGPHLGGPSSDHRRDSPSADGRGRARAIRRRCHGLHPARRAAFGAAVEGTLETCALGPGQDRQRQRLRHLPGRLRPDHHQRRHQRRLDVHGRRQTINCLRISTIDVLLSCRTRPPAGALPSPVVPASLAAANPALDLAVLYISTLASHMSPSATAIQCDVGRQVSALGYTVRTAVEDRDGNGLRHRSPRSAPAPARFRPCAAAMMAIASSCR